MVPFAPRLITVVLPNLAHHAPMIQQQALRTNQALQKVIQNLPTTPSGSSTATDKDRISISSNKTGNASVSTPPSTAGSTSQSSVTKTPTQSKEAELVPDVTASPASDRTVQVQMPTRIRSTTAPALGDVIHHASMLDLSDTTTQGSRSQSPTSTTASTATAASVPGQSNGQQPVLQQNQTLTQSPVQIEQDPSQIRLDIKTVAVYYGCDLRRNDRFLSAYCAYDSCEHIPK